MILVRVQVELFRLPPASFPRLGVGFLLFLGIGVGFRSLLYFSLAPHSGSPLTFQFVR